MTCVKLRRFVQGDASELPSLCTEYTAGPYFGRDWLRASGRKLRGFYPTKEPWDQLASGLQSDVHRGCGACDNSARASYQFANARRNSSGSLAMLAAIRRALSAREIAKPGRLWPPTAGYGLDRGRGPRRSEMPAGASPHSPPNILPKEWCEGWRLAAHENRRDRGKPP
jgi:hypothetical protein